MASSAHSRCVTEKFRWAWRTARRHKLAVIAGVWGLVLVIMAFSSNAVSVKEQLPAIDVSNVVEEATSEAVASLSREGVSFSVGALVIDDCDITVIRGGQRIHRDVTVYVDESEAASVALGLAEDLKQVYPLVKSGLDPRPRFRTVTDGYVELLMVTSDNTITWSADTGCRPYSSPVGIVEPAFNQPSEVATTIDMLGVENPTWRLAQSQCVSDSDDPSVASTVWAVGELPSDGPDNISAVVARLPDGAKVFVSKKNLVSYRWEDRAVTVMLTGNQVEVSATQTCR